MDREMLMDVLFKYGLVQFGRYGVPDGGISPFRLSLELLVSYPEALQLVAAQVVAGMTADGVEVERLLCPHDALPLGTLVSVATGIPLVYSRGRGEVAVRDLVGAYDIDHPTLLLVYGRVPWVDYGPLVRWAGRVGLKTVAAYALVDSEVGGTSLTGTSWRRGVTVRGLVAEASQQGWVTDEMAAVVRQWVG